MTVQTTLREILQKAIGKEIESQRLYHDLSQIMEKPSVTDAFEELSRQEQGHQHLLERYLCGELGEGALTQGETIDYKIAEKLDQPGVTADMELKDVFLMAANREKFSHDFYLVLAGIHPEGEVKRLLEVLATEELMHKQRVEFLYSEVAFPQTDGG